ncbi:MAG: LPS export ABC transporter permease LptG [Rickettsiales bacterium]|nr:LPS export ABC transporter permease LptG [Rickettsiales bacterium]OUW70986.1 MAG: LPS export ABC transporter permease LptG [Rickettsiales bacterium TMED211]
MIKPFLILNYLIKQNLYAIFIISFFCCFLFLTIDLIELLRRSSSKEIPFDIIFKIALLHLPSLFPIILPTIFLLSSMQTFMRLNKNSELSVMRASGISIWIFMLPSVLNCIIISILYITFFNPLFSQMNVKFKSFESQYFKGSTGLHIISPTGLWLREIEDKKEYVINASHYSTLDSTLQNVIIFEFGEEEKFLRRIDASEVKMSDDHWDLSNVSVVKINQTPESYINMRMKFNLSIKKIEQNFRSADTISFWKLPDYIQNLEKSGFTARKHKVYFHYLLSFPFILIAMVLLGCSLSIRKSRNKNQFINIFIGIILGIIFHFSTDVLRTIGMSGTLPIFFATYGVPLISIFFLLGILIHTEDG